MGNNKKINQGLEDFKNEAQEKFDLIEQKAQEKFDLIEQKAQEKFDLIEQKAQEKLDLIEQEAQERLENFQNESTALDTKIEQQKSLYDANIRSYGSILNYKKELFDSEEGKDSVKSQIDGILLEAQAIEEKINEFTSFWTGSDDNLPFHKCTEQIKDTYKRTNEISEKLKSIDNSISIFTGKYKNTLNNKLKEVEDFKTEYTNTFNSKLQKVEDFKTEYTNTFNNKLKEVEDFKTEYTNTFNSKLQEVEDIKKDLKNYRDQVVGGTLFSEYEITANESKLSSEKYSKASIRLLFIVAAILAGTLLWMICMGELKSVHMLLLSSISVVLFTASFLCSSKSKIAYKSFEEYLHKATLLKSFVGYREQYKETLDDEEYRQFFHAIITAVKVNVSDKVDEYLQFKWPWQKAVECINNACKVATRSIEKTQDVETRSTQKQQNPAIPLDQYDTGSDEKS